MKTSLQNSVSVYLISLLTLLSCSQKPRSQQWTEGMEGMADSIKALAPYLYDGDRYSDPKNSKFIATKLDSLEHASQSIDAHVARAISGDDPIFTVGLSSIKRNIARANQGFKLESFQYSQELLQNSINYCVQCHMRTDVGRSFRLYDQFQTSLTEDSDKIELAKIFVATRQFTRAIETLESSLTQQNGFTTDLLPAKILIAIAVKNLNQPELALQSLSKLTVQNATDKKLLTRWQSDLSKAKQGAFNKLTLKQALTPVPAKESELRLVETLYKNLALHRALSSETDKGTRGQIMNRLGSIYESESAIGFYELPDLYFESCIIESPHSAIAQKCYLTLERRLRKFVGIGLNDPIPDSDKAHMSKLRALSQKAGTKDVGTGTHDNL